MSKYTNIEIEGDVISEKKKRYNSNRPELVAIFECTSNIKIQLVVRKAMI
jgi:hypothetical protein